MLAALHRYLQSGWISWALENRSHCVVTSDKEVMFSHVSVCLYVCYLDYKKNTDQIFVKVYGMHGHNPGNNQLDFDWLSPVVKVTRGQKAKIVFFTNNCVQNCRRESPQKLKSSLFNFLNNSKYDYCLRADSFKDRFRSKVRGVRPLWNRLAQNAVEITVLNSNVH